MIRFGMASIVVALALASSPAGAFDLQQGGTSSSGAKASSPASGSAGGSEIGAKVGLGEESKPTAGAEVRIPGLGKLGVLPKLDFGLELLYGAAEPKRVEDSAEQPDEGVVVRGTLKHRF